MTHFSVRHFFIGTLNGETKHGEVLGVSFTQDSSFEELEATGVRSLIAVGLATREHRERNPFTHQGGRLWSETTWTGAPAFSLGKL